MEKAIRLEKIGLPLSLVIVILLFSGCLSCATALQEHQMATSNETMSLMMKRGDIVMGFDQNKISHQFSGNAAGGEITITALNGSDIETIKQIQTHILDIQKEFSVGNFTRPFFIHAEEVPGTKVMAEKKDLIKYDMSQMKNGSRLVLTANNTDLINAINEFMKFQAGEHLGH
jgi:hypothetical protein